jgi:hypothetical protein
MCVKSILRPPKGEEKLPSRLVPPEKGTGRSLASLPANMKQLYLLMGTLYLWHILAIVETSSVELGNTTAVG